MSRILYFNEEEHRYTDDCDNVYTSTTTLLGQYKQKFDTKGQAKRLAQQGTGIYKHKSAKQIEQMWAEGTAAACAKGSKTHDELEHGVKETSMFKDAVRYMRQYDPQNRNRLFTIDDILKLDNLKPVDPQLFYEKVGHKYPIIQQTIEWYVANGFYLFAEIGVYDETKLISGMIDLWAVKGQIFVILDWKTNKDDIIFESGYYKRDEQGQSTNVWVRKNKDYMKYPLDDLPTCKGSDYAMQLSVYAYMCEQRGLKCDGLVIFHIRDQYVLNRYGMPYRDAKGNYIVDETKPREVKPILMPYHKEQVEKLFKYHAKTNLSGGIQFKITM